jgi:hypothetical protein
MTGALTRCRRLHGRYALAAVGCMVWVGARADELPVIGRFGGASFTLRGTIVNVNDARRSLAILSDGGGASWLVRVGSSLPNAGTLVRVEPKRVLLETAGTLYEVNFNNDAAALMPGIQTGRPMPQQAVEMGQPQPYAEPQPYVDRSQYNQGIDRTEYPMIP